MEPITYTVRLREGQDGMDEDYTQPTLMSTYAQACKLSYVFSQASVSAKFSLTRRSKGEFIFGKSGAQFFAT